MNAPNTKPKRKVVRTKGKGVSLRLSPNGIRAYESCKARYLYTYVILPRVDSQKMQEIARTGKLLHELAALDLDEKKSASILHFESRAVREELTEFASLLQEREYFTLPSVKEVHMEVPVAGGSLQGIADRICREDDGFLVVDYKTGRFPNWNQDRKQVLAYAHLLSRSQGVEPERITIALDYLRMNVVNRYTVDAEDLGHYEEYLAKVFGEIRTLRERFMASRDIKAVSHTPGDCLGCPAVGVCKAYQVTVNPVIDTKEPKVLSTSQIVEELGEREAAARLLDERVKVLKAALLARHEGGDTDVEASYKVITGNSTTYPARKVVDTILDDLLKRAITTAEGQFLLDENAVKQELAAILLTLLPEQISPNNIPAEYAASLQPFKAITSKAAYLRAKSR